MFLGEEDVPAGGEASIKALRDILANTKDNYLWIVDPIDGTANFASGLDLCGVTVTVVKDNKALIGVIYDPHKDEMFTAIDERVRTVTANAFMRHHKSIRFKMRLLMPDVRPILMPLQPRCGV